MNLVLARIIFYPNGNEIWSYLHWNYKLKCRNILTYHVLLRKIQYVSPILEKCSALLNVPSVGKASTAKQAGSKESSAFWTWELLPPIYHWSLIFNAALYYCLFVVSKAPVSKIKGTLAFVANYKSKMKTAPGKN